MAGQRSIFQEVEGTRSAAPQPQGGMISAAQRGRNPVRRWLSLLALLVIAMILVGGLTRLTDSGLSIVEWRPLTGAIPPLNEADWMAEFTKYQATPQFQLQNVAMSLADFKQIYWWEWAHRQLGRTIGMVWAIGFAWFYFTRRIPAGWTGRLLFVGVLGGVQGALGWWMVSSGLTGRMVTVASYRLALHLGLGFAILGVLAWYVLSLSRPEAQQLQARRSGEARLFGWATAVAAVAFVQVLLGALVAGIDAGRAFPTWPLMGDSFFPADALYVAGGGPAWLAAFENPGLVQFDHRMAGYLLFVLVVVAWVVSRASVHPVTRRAFDWVLAMAAVQVVLGIFTVLHAAPLHLGITHQLGAVVLWLLVIRARHRARYPIVTSIRGRT